jgi:hypothetical protein
VGKVARARTGPLRRHCPLYPSAVAVLAPRYARALVARAPAQAFISHSWRDSPDEKWATLQSWREGFVRDNGREPMVWIDRCARRVDSRADPIAPTPASSSRHPRRVATHALTSCARAASFLDPSCSRSCCLDPTRLATVLRLLPVFCAACDKLVALRGPTYLKRLWYVKPTPLACCLTPPMRARNPHSIPIPHLTYSTL